MKKKRKHDDDTVGYKVSTPKTTTTYGEALTMVFLYQKCMGEGDKNDGYSLEIEFDKYCYEFNRWLSLNYPNTDLDEEFECDILEFMRGEMSKLAPN